MTALAAVPAPDAELVVKAPLLELFDTKIYAEKPDFVGSMVHSLSGKPVVQAAHAVDGVSLRIEPGRCS